MAEHDDEGNPPGPDEPRTDLLLVGGRNPRTERLQVLRLHHGQVETGELAPTQEGQPLTGELVRLRPRTEHPRLFDVEVLLGREDRQITASPAHPGPARVTTDQYRDNYARIFGARDGKKGQLPN